MNVYKSSLLIPTGQNNYRCTTHAYLCERCLKYYEEKLNSLIEKHEILKTHCVRCGYKQEN